LTKEEYDTARSSGSPDREFGDGIVAKSFMPPIA
jgi:hypothetical protein